MLLSSSKHLFKPCLRRLSHSLTVLPTSTEQVVTVKAYYIAQKIDLTKVHSDVYATQKKSKYIEPKSVTIEIDKTLHQYVTVFKYGSVVLFNIPDSAHTTHIHNITKSAVVTPIVDSTGLQHTENYKIIINNNLNKLSIITAEHLNCRYLDNNNISIVSSIIAQSVALDYYAMTSDKLLNAFMSINMKVSVYYNIAYY